jgi:replicative DNA helicase
MTTVPPIIQAEQLFLAQMLLNGKPLRYPYEFMDDRHRVIFWELGHLQTVMHEPDADALIDHLAEYRKLPAAGGSGYIRALFRGVIPARGRYGR